MITEEMRERVFEKTAGTSYYCEKELSFYNRSREGRGAWEVKHLRPRARGGRDHLNNLRAACWPCNLEKSTSPSRSQKQLTIGDRSVRASRRRWHSASQAVIPAVGLGVLTYFLAKDHYTRKEGVLEGSPEEAEVKRKSFLIAGLVGLGVIIGFVVLRELFRPSMAPGWEKRK